MKLNFPLCSQINFRFKSILEADRKGPGPVRMSWNSWFMFWTSGTSAFQSAKTQFISHGAVRLDWNFKLGRSRENKRRNTFWFQKVFKYMGALQLPIFRDIGVHRIPILFSLILPLLGRSFKLVHEKSSFLHELRKLIQVRFTRRKMTHG